MMLRLRNSLFLAVAALLFLGEVAGPLTARAETRVGGTLSGQTRWTKADSPYVVVEDLDVPVGSVLTIDAGVVVRFKPNLADQKGLKPSTSNSWCGERSRPRVRMAIRSTSPPTRSM